MKRIICVLLIALLCVGLGACSSEPNNNNPASDLSSVSSQNNANEASGASSKSSGKAYASIKEYLDTPAVQSEVNNAIESSDSSMNLEVYAEDDTLVYDYKFSQTYDEETTSILKSSLDNALEENASTFQTVVTALKTYVDVENPKVKVIYRNGDNTDITDKVYE